jgi:hypothetical protein
MGMNWAEHSVEIQAPIETCFGAIIDYETFPKWQGAVVDTEVLDWDGQGRGKRVRLYIDAKVRKVDYTLDYRYDQPERIEWDFVEGNGINDADGHYLFEDMGDGRTRATYKLGLEVGIPLPGPVARRAHKSTLKGSVDDLKREAERRAASSARATGRTPANDREDESPAEREAKLAERAGIRRPSRQSAPAGMEPTAEWPAEDGSHSIAELPALVIGRAASVSRRVAEGGVETAREITAGAAGAGLGAARRAVGLGLKVPSRIAERVRGLARDR